MYRIQPGNILRLCRRREKRRASQSNANDLVNLKLPELILSFWQTLTRKRRWETMGSNSAHSVARSTRNLRGLRPPAFQGFSRNYPCIAASKSSSA